jgi:hypothetical protein
MVTPRNLSAYAGVIPVSAAHRKIPGGPCYPLDEVKRVASEANGVYLATRKSITDAQELGIDTQDLGKLLGELQAKNYHDSEWCEISSLNWVACDSYKMVRNEYNEELSRQIQVEYFFKFGINKRFTAVLSVSNHLAR